MDTLQGQLLHDKYIVYSVHQLCVDIVRLVNNITYRCFYGADRGPCKHTIVSCMADVCVIALRTDGFICNAQLTVV